MTETHSQSYPHYSRIHQHRCDVESPATCSTTSSLLIEDAATNSNHYPMSITHDSGPIHLLVWPEFKRRYQLHGFSYSSPCPFRNPSTLGSPTRATQGSLCRLALKHSLHSTLCPKSKRHRPCIPAMHPPRLLHRLPIKPWRITLRAGKKSKKESTSILFLYTHLLWTSLSGNSTSTGLSAIKTSTSATLGPLTSLPLTPAIHAPLASPNKAPLASPNKALLASPNKALLASLNKVLLAWLNKALLPSPNKALLPSPNEALPPFAERGPPPFGRMRPSSLHRTRPPLPSSRTRSLSPLWLHEPFAALTAHKEYTIHAAGACFAGESHAATI